VFENANWKTNPLNTAIRMKTNMNRGGFCAISTCAIARCRMACRSPSFYASLPGSPIQSKTVATAAGAIVTFDCDYTPISDNVRTARRWWTTSRSPTSRPAMCQGRQDRSCYQAIVYSSRWPRTTTARAGPPVVPVTNVDQRLRFRHAGKYWQPWPVQRQDLKLNNVTIAGKVTAPHSPPDEALTYTGAMFGLK
jgi:hypothetical protein